MELKEKDEIRRIAREEARREYKRLKEKEKTNKEQDTRELMKQYRDAVFHMNNISSADDAAQVYEHISISSHFIDKVENANTSTRIMLRNINSALEEIKKRRIKEGRQQEYRAFQLYYLEGLTYDKVKDLLEEETGDRIGDVTPKRWCDGVLKELSSLLWGI